MRRRSVYYWYDSLSETWQETGTKKLVLTGSPQPDGSLPDENPLTLSWNRRGLSVEFTSAGTPLYWDGEYYRESPLQFPAGDPHSFVFRGQAGFLINLASPPPDQKNGQSSATWKLYRSDTGEILAQAPLRELPDLVGRNGWPIEQLATLPEAVAGFEMTGVWLRDLFSPRELQANPSTEGHSHLQATAHQVVPEAKPDDSICPACWLPFDECSVMAIASHEDLTDPILGENERLRFYPTRYTSDGIPIDSKGLPASGLACPHCRVKLPRDYLAIPHHIFSLVGASQSGKSYFLTILIRMLQRTLFQRFGITFRDEDPQANAILSDMKNKLFQGITPREAALLKTQLEGEMYLRLKRFGQEVSLPRPFSFTLTPENRRADTQGIIFYDNAGEHFQPGVSIEDSPGALHVAVSSAIFFLFDPAPNALFRQRLPHHQDPQLSRPIPDIQDVIMAEMENRIKRLRNLGVKEAINTPLAVIIGKSDIWKSLLGDRPLAPVITDSGWDEEALQKNSQRLREMMVELEPSIVANAEALSDRVIYFAVSAFGHSPEKFTDPDTNAEYLAPHPGKLQPDGIEVPVLWALRLVAPQLFDQA